MNNTRHSITCLQLCRSGARDSHMTKEMLGKGCIGRGHRTTISAVQVVSSCKAAWNSRSYSQLLKIPNLAMWQTLLPSKPASTPI